MYTEHKDITIEYTYYDYDIDSDGKAHKVERTGYKTITVNVNIHNEDFNQSVDESVGKIEGLTGAIVGFKTANVAVKKANEQAIVGRVTSGFMNMIEQNINLESAGMEADMHALAGELTQQCKELDHKHDVMSKDFNRIKSRYSGLFETINKEFRNRMQAVIKPCFDFVSNIKIEQNRRAGSNLLSMATVGGKESDSARIAIQASKMKHNATSLINASRNFIHENGSLKRVVATFSQEGNLGETYFAPVVVMNGRCSASDEGQTEMFMNPMCKAGGKTEELLMQQYNGLNDTPMPSDMLENITSYFNQQLEDMNDGTTETRRIIGQMKALFERNTMRTFA